MLEKKGFFCLGWVGKFDLDDLWLSVRFRLPTFYLKQSENCDRSYNLPIGIVLNTKPFDLVSNSYICLGSTVEFIDPYLSNPSTKRRDCIQTL